MAIHKSGNKRKYEPAIAELYAEQDALSPWKNTEAKRIRANMRLNQIPFSATCQKFVRNNSFIRLFNDFAVKMCAAENRTYDSIQCLKNDELVEMWLSTIVEEDCGATRPASARKAINAKRLALRLPALPKFSTTTDLVKCAKAKNPKAVKKSEVASKSMITEIINAYETSTAWWMLQFALMTAIGFLCLLRFGEVRQFVSDGIKLVQVGVREVQPLKFRRDGSVILQPLPPARLVIAIRLLCPFRKTTQTEGSWLTVTDTKTITMMMIHLHNMRRLLYVGIPLFPSRRRVAKRWMPLCPWMPTHNPVSRKTYIDLMRQSLRDVCGLPVDVSMMYSGHTLRISGSNSVRKDTQLTEDVNRQLGSWMSLASKKSYDRQSLIEQMEVTQHLNFL